MKKSSIALVFIVIIATIFGVFFIHPDYWGNSFRPWRLGLDLVGGSHLVYKVDMTNVPSSDRDAVMNGLRDVIERRVNLFGVSEPQVLTAKSGDQYRLIVDLAGVKDIQAAIKQIGETPFLLFAEEATSTLPAQVQTANGQTVQTQGSANNQWVPTQLTGRYVQGATLGFNSVTHQPEVYLDFNSQGATMFQTLTAANVGKRLGVFLDGALITAPTVNEEISGGKAQITGQFTVDEARTLVSRFNAGALPAPISQLSQQTIGASLGANSLQKMIFAGLIGTLLVMLFMIIYYKRLGLFASIALVMYTVLVLSIFKFLAITMTLAGIAGIILSIGMAVDANILIFERTKEEIARGVHHHAAILEGFRRAWPSIRDSNLTTMITAIILYSFTSSFVKGFALALFIGVILSMFSAITITRNLLRIFVKDTKEETKPQNA